MVNAALECGKPDFRRSTIEMVDKHTQVLEAIGKGKDITSSEFRLQTEGTLGNPPRVRRKGGVVGSASSSQSTKTRRKLQTCTSCGNYKR
jgi:hypothetical protein